MIPSLSIIVTEAWPRSPTITSLGRVDTSILRSKDSSISNITSSVIGTENGTLVVSAGNVTINGPEL